MSIWDRFKSSKNMPVAQGINFFTFGGDGCTPGFTIDLTSNSGFKDVYDKCSILKTVINRNATAMANGRWWIVDSKDNDLIDSYPGVKARFESPNPLQAFGEFKMQMDVYRQLYGRVYVYAPTPVGRGVQDALAYWVINPRHIEIELSGKMYGQSRQDDIISKIWLNVSGTRTELERDNVLIISDVNQSLSCSTTNFDYISRLTGLEYSIKNLIQAEIAIYSMNKNRGAMGIISSDNKDNAGTAPLKPREKEKIQEAYRSMYGLSDLQSNVIISDSSLKWQPITMSVRDLMIFEGMEENTQTICDAYDYPYELLGSTKGVTYANKSEAKKFHYEDSIIPFSKVYEERFSKFLGLTTAKVAIDFSEVGALKTAETETAKTFGLLSASVKNLYNLGLISAEEARLKLGYDEEIYGKTMYDESSDESTSPGADSGD